MTEKNKNPGAGGAARGAGGVALGQASASSKPHRSREALTAQVLPNGEPVTVVGRQAQTLRLLIARGAAGFTSGEASPLGWARRTSHYVMQLRRAGFPIGMVREPATDGSRVGRYFLGSPVAVLAEGDAV
ncbi:hypothetical protein [Phenylobacterium sp.]|jgi:hypothetical protein|uniref:winged helix domain-containing protein n=1 Tax=Phenylobacterium sp. TaxID=1871053 RepID=UPI0037C9873A